MWRSKPANHTCCPRCQSPTQYFGYHPESRQQRYRCKNPGCRHQFIPGLESRLRSGRKAPELACPWCGAKMYIFKELPDSLRLRCANSRKKGPERCTHKINLPRPQGAWVISTDPIDDLPKTISPNFYWNKMAYSKETVSLALFLLLFVSLPANRVAFILANLFNLSPSHDTLTRWQLKAALALQLKLGPLTIPDCQRLHADETRFKERGEKLWLWMTKESLFQSIQSYHLSPRRSTQHARNLLARALKNSPCLKEATFVFDGLWSYISAKGDLDQLSKTNYTVYKELTDPVTNNLLERHWGTLKSLARPFRGFKSRQGLWAFVTGQIIYHNYFRPHPKLHGLTPAEAAGIKLAPIRSKWKLMTSYLN